MSPWSVNVARAEGAAEALLDKYSANDLPICPFKLAEADNIHVRAFTPSGNSFNGCLIQTKNSFGILYADSIQNEGFKRFTVSHELGHYHIPGHALELLKNGAHYSSVDYGSLDPYEREAEIFAAALLMPRRHVLEILSKEGNGLGAIEAIASERYCHVSLTAAAIRYSELSQDATIVVMSKGGKILAPFLSPLMREIPRTTWPRRGNRIPPKTATQVLTGIPGVHSERRVSDGLLSQWLSGAPDMPVVEEAVSLGSYGKILTVITSRGVIEVDELSGPNEPEEEIENLGLPSERGYFEKRKRRA